MKHFIVYILLVVMSVTTAHSQTFRPNMNKDSLFTAGISWMNPVKKAEYEKLYKEADETNRDFIVFMLSMPTSSKKEMIRNIDTNYTRIAALKEAYASMVPNGYIVRFEYNAASTVIVDEESFDLRIQRPGSKEGTVDQAWRLSRGSDTLKRMLTELHWTQETVDRICGRLAAANCVGIENGTIPTIAFARSGMGLFSIKLFDHQLTTPEIKQYNDGCRYIFYKDNIVLEYGGGAVGPQCFSSIDPDR